MEEPIGVAKTLFGGSDAAGEHLGVEHAELVSTVLFGLEGSLTIFLRFCEPTGPQHKVRQVVKTLDFSLRLVQAADAVQGLLGQSLGRSEVMKGPRGIGNAAQPVVAVPREIALLRTLGSVLEQSQCLFKIA